MTRDEAVQWFWKTCPVGCRIMVVLDGVSAMHGWAWVICDRPLEERGGETWDLSNFLRRIGELIGEELGEDKLRYMNDGEVMQVLEFGVLEAYGRKDACKVEVRR
jgi:hypothetical protein